MDQTFVRLDDLCNRRLRWPGTKMRTASSRVHTRRGLSSLVAVQHISGKGRAVVAERAITHGETVFSTQPMAAVLKGNESCCRECFGPLPRSDVKLCSSTCEIAYERRGGTMLERADLTPLHRLHEQENRKFALIANLLASLLAEVKATGRCQTRGRLWSCATRSPLEVVRSRRDEKRARGAARRL